MSSFEARVRSNYQINDIFKKLNEKHRRSLIENSNKIVKTSICGKKEN